MSSNFYSEGDYKYTEIAICLEDTEIPAAKGKFFLPIITPMLNSEVPYEKQEQQVNTNNILSDINLSSIVPCTISNYVELPLPSGVTSAKKGDKFQVNFVGGEVNNPVLQQKM